jgi:mannose-6-phosphate isomerase-like protein (cupin superfamily)
MAYAGQSITNPVSGETITFIRTAADTDGAALEIELELTPDGRVPGMHVHPHQQERFEVLEGTMTFKLGRKTITAGPGEVVVVAKRSAHKFANGGDGIARARVTVTPALRMEELFETACALAEEGKTMRTGMPKPVHLALFVREFRDEVHAPFPPAWMQRASLAPLALIGKARGHAERYTRPEAAPAPAAAQVPVYA